MAEAYLAQPQSGRRISGANREKSRENGYRWLGDRMLANVENFPEVLESVGRDAERCVTHVYTFQAFNYLLSDSELFDAVNRNAAFWNCAMHAHLSAAFVSLGRLYETNAEHHNLGKLVALAGLNAHLFSRESLRLRKTLAGMTRAQADKFVGDAFEADAKTFRSMRKVVAEARSMYDGKARPIRDQIFAHTGRLTRSAQASFFNKLPAREFESLALTPLRVHDALQRLFCDGHEPTLRDAPSNIADVVAAKPGRRASTWHHVHVAAETAALLESIR
jgi:hypothetical protein